MAAKNFDRDLNFIQKFEDSPGTSTTTPNKNSAPSPRTDGVVYDDVGVIMRSDVSDYTLSANLQVASGVILRRADTRAVYRINGFTFAEDSTAGIMAIGMAVAPASPTGAAAGETVPHWQFLHMHRPKVPTIDITVCVDNFGTISSTDYSERDILFYVSFMNNSSSGYTGVFTYNISVQRLAVGVPEYESKYR
jgi:hypothetical protein